MYTQLSLKSELCLECLQIPLKPGDHLCHLGLLLRHCDYVVLESLVNEVNLNLLKNSEIILISEIMVYG